jgi:hypothetical protein
MPPPIYCLGGVPRAIHWLHFMLYLIIFRYGCRFHNMPCLLMRIFNLYLQISLHNYRGLQRGCALGYNQLTAQRAHHSATVALALFCVYYDVPFPLINIHTLLSFIEFLLCSNLSVPTVKNYVCSIKSHFKANNVCVEVFSSHHLTLALSSL